MAQVFTVKKYRCDRCGHVVEQSTNHFGKTWSCGRSGVCPACPPWAKYSEFGGQTTWTCIEKPVEQMGECMECGDPTNAEVCQRCKRNDMRI
jgi:hypothetical protein